MPELIGRMEWAVLLLGIARERLPEDLQQKQSERPEGDVSGNIAANL